MRPLYIFDIDGTLANNDHRRHLVEKRPEGASTDWKQDWSAFEAGCANDLPISATIRTLNVLADSADIWFFTGRSENARDATQHWLWLNTGLLPHELRNELLMMRPAGDSRPDHVVKQEMFDRMLDEDRKRLVAVFDDRKSVVDMWRANGVACFQVAPGDF